MDSGYGYAPLNRSNRFKKKKRHALYMIHWWYSRWRIGQSNKELSNRTTPSKYCILNANERGQPREIEKKRIAPEENNAQFFSHSLTSQPGYAVQVPRRAENITHKFEFQRTKYSHNFHSIYINLQYFSIKVVSVRFSSSLHSLHSPYQICMAADYWVKREIERRRGKYE